jgi:Peptidase_C39 like family
MSVANPLAVTLVPQATQNWCWAASGQMIMNYLGNPAVNQCQEATDYPFAPPQTNPRTNWCTSPPDTLGFTGWPQFASYGFNATQTPYGTPISWAQLKQEIDGNRPVAFVWAWRDGGGHMMVAIGYESVDGVDRVIILDPSPPHKGDRRSIPYDDFVAGNYLGEPYTHWCDFHGIVMTHTGAYGAGAPGADPSNDASKSLAAAQAYMPTSLKALGPGASPMNAATGPAFAVKAVGLNQLRQLSAPGGSAGNIIDSTPVRSFQYPVTLHGTFAAAISTHMAPGGTWAAREANAEWVRIFNDVRARHSIANNIPVEQYSLVSFNALNLYFLYYKQNGETFMVPTQDSATLGLTQGVAQPAKTILDAVTKIAIGHTGGPS